MGRSKIWIYKDSDRREARVATPQEVADGRLNPHHHQHQFGHIAFRHDHSDAIRYHEHAPELLIAQVRAGVATVHDISHEEL